MATLKDIAEKTDLSVTAVSRILNSDNTLVMSEEKKEYVRKIAKELEYQTPRKRKRKKEKKFKIAMFYWYSGEDDLSDPYYISIRRGIERQASKNNVQFHMIYSCDDYLLSKEQVDGIVALGHFTDSEIETFEKISDSIVFVDSSPDVTKYDSILIDFRHSVESIFNYMTTEKNLKSIGYLGGRAHVNNYEIELSEKREGFFIENAKKYGVYDPNNIYVGDFTFKSGYNMMNTAIEKGNLPQAFFGANDSIAIGAIKALHEHNIKIPEECGIIGFNDISMASYSSPALTTVRVNTEFMGKTAVDLILEKLNGREVCKKVIVPTDIIIRESF